MTGTAGQHGIRRCWDEAQAGGRSWRRTVVRTPWLVPGDDLELALRAATDGLRRPGDVLAVSEKVVVLLTGRAVDAREVEPSALARLLAGAVRPVGRSRGLSVPQKMEYVLRTQGRARLLLAAAAGAVTRPLGVRGVFYRMAGTLARDLDGLRPPYVDLLLPPVHEADAEALAQRLEERLGVGVAVVDVNDRGGSVRAVSGSCPARDVVLAALTGNPMGQRDRSTPVALLRPPGPPD